MKYPKFLVPLNNFLGIFSGGIILFVGLLAVYEALVRTVFDSPTSWSLDISKYAIIWAVFLGSTYSFQEKGHVAVDFIRDIVLHHFGKKALRGITIIGYTVCLIVIGVFLFNGIEMCMTAIKSNRLTLANVQIPVVYLYAAIVVGPLFMLATIIGILMDLFGGNDEYLS